MRRSKLFPTMLVLAGLVIMLTAGFSAFAADNASQTVTFSNPVVSSLVLGTATVDFGNVVVGANTAVGGSLTATSNGTWAVTVKGADFAGGAGKTIPITKLTATAGAEIPAVVSNAGTSLISSHAPGVDVAYALAYSLAIAGTDPGSASYSTSLIYTISGS